MLLKDSKNERVVVTDVRVCVCSCTPTALLITVVPAIVVAVTVPQAANTVAILAVKLVLLALPGSCRGTKGGERFQTTNKCTTNAKSGYWTRTGQDVAVQEFIFTAVLRARKVQLLKSGSGQRVERRDLKQAELSRSHRSEAEKQNEYPVVRSVQKRHLIDSYLWHSEEGIWMLSMCVCGCLHGHRSGWKHLP